MFNVCPGCGQYSEDKVIDPSGPYAICPHCGHRHRFRQLPLFWIAGPSCAGKTTLAMALVPSLPECVVLETDILWHRAFIDPDDGYRAYHNLWLRLAKSIAQSGRPVVLLGGGMPEDIERCPERRYFRTVHYMALVCEERELVRRLESRPAWRGCADPEFVRRMLVWNRHLMDRPESTDPPMATLNTAERSVTAGRHHVVRWVREHLALP